MSNIERHSHWQNIYQTNGERDVSWFQESPRISLDLIRETGAKTDAPIIDIGGGASRLVDTLLDAGFEQITVLDLSDKALAMAKARLGARSTEVKWIAADVTTWEPPQLYEVWHDRAAFHFLVDPKDRAAYAERVLRAVRRGRACDHRDVCVAWPRTMQRPPRRSLRCRFARYDTGPLVPSAGEPYQRPSNAYGDNPAVPIHPLSASCLRKAT